MWGETKQSTSSKTSLIYITIGALTVVWTTIYYIYLRRTDTHNESNAYLFVYGFAMTGVVLIGIGVLVGRIGRSAMRAEVAAAPGMVVTPTPPGAVAEPPVVNGSIPAAPPPAVAAVTTVPQQIPTRTVAVAQ